MWDVVIGGAIALSGTLLAQWYQSHRDQRRWEQEAARRFLDRRAEVYTDFVTVMRGYAEGMREWEMHHHGPPPSTLDGSDFDSVWDRLFPIKIFGTPAAYDLGERAMHALYELSQRDGADFERYEAAEDLLIERIRSDLDLTAAAAAGVLPSSRWGRVLGKLTRSGRA
jgi:hypothetical protein